MSKQVLDFEQVKIGFEQVTPHDTGWFLDEFTRNNLIYRIFLENAIPVFWASKNWFWASNPLESGLFSNEFLHRYLFI